MNATRILIVEDEILIAEDLKDTLNNLGYHEIEMAHDKSTAIDKIKRFEPHVVLLDIRLENETDGLEIGTYMAQNSSIPFIYITAHSDVAMVREILKTQPAGYITKPVKKSDLFASIGVVLENGRKKEGNTISIKDGYSTILIDEGSILYVEAEGNYLNIICENKKYVARQSMDSFQEELNKDMFYKIHRSYLINIDHITKYSRKEVQIGEVRLPVSRNISADFEAFMLNR